MRRKKPVWFGLTIVFLLAAYILITTSLINDKSYKKRAWDEVKHNEHVLNWEDGEVSTISLQEQRIKQLFISKPTTFAKMNRSLLWLNGNKAVRVLFHTDFEGLMGPMTVYFNPFTKQVIGYDVME